MGKYYIRNGELYHAENHKYIDRKWVGGRWVYTYPNDVNGKKSSLRKKPEPQLNIWGRIGQGAKSAWNTATTNVTAWGQNTARKAQAGWNTTKENVTAWGQNTARKTQTGWNTFKNGASTAFSTLKTEGARATRKGSLFAKSLFDQEVTVRTSSSGDTRTYVQKGRISKAVDSGKSFIDHVFGGSKNETESQQRERKGNAAANSYRRRVNEYTRANKSNTVANRAVRKNNVDENSRRHKYKRDTGRNIYASKYDRYYY